MRLSSATTMTHCFVLLCMLCSFFNSSISCSEFLLDGDYLLGGLFTIHHVTSPVERDKPEAIHCSSQPFLLANYRMFQIMRFAVEEINNSTELLPNVSLGYELFDHCSEIQSFSEIFNLISTKGSVHARVKSDKRKNHSSKVIGVVGPFSTTQTLTVAPLFMVDFMPMVSYGASSSILSKKNIFPSFLRTVNSNGHVIKVIIRIIKHFKWRWVAFLNSNNDFGIDGLEIFINMIEKTDICLAYTKGLDEKTNFSQLFKQIHEQRINVVIVFAPNAYAEALIESAIRHNIKDKVWIADDGWALNRKLPRMEGIRNIGTVLGISQLEVTIPGFSEFVYTAVNAAQCEGEKQQEFCNQICNCGSLSTEDVVNADPSFSYQVYSAVYSIAHALHSILQNGAGTGYNSTAVYPHMVLAKLKKSKFKLLNQAIQFDENGDPKFGSYSIIFWNKRGDAQEIGYYHFHTLSSFFINDTLIEWFTDGDVPTSVCSPECPVGYMKKPYENYKCCFTCEMCPPGTYVNSTEDPLKCVLCAETEWSNEASTSCNQRAVEYVTFTDTEAILLMFAACAFVAITVSISVLFAINYNTPVVRSAGGPMCFLILGCLALCSVSVFFYFDKPTTYICILRSLPFILFYTVCIACFVVRSFQIVCIFKIGAKFPKIHKWWVKYHGQWLIIMATFFTQALLVFIGYFLRSPKPYNETLWYPEKIILFCDFSPNANAASVVFLLFLCCLCFIFSYIGTDLPKNYNEAKSITFCLMLLILSWIVFVTELMLYRGKHIISLNALTLLSSLYSFLLWYFLPKCYIIIFQPQKNTQQYFQGLIQTYTKTISQ